MGPLYTSGYNDISRGKIEVLREEHAPLSYGLPRKRTESSVVSSRRTSRLRCDSAYLSRAKDARKLWKSLQSPIYAHINLRTIYPM